MKDKPVGIRCGGVRDCTVFVPGSKSFSHRMAISASLSSGISYIYNMLKSEDLSLTLNALSQLGAIIEKNDNFISINGVGGRPKPAKEKIFLGNSGTSMRLLTAVAALGQGEYFLYGTDRMHERPVSELTGALTALGVDAKCVNKNECPPVRIIGGGINKRSVSIDCSKSSQYLSALLLTGPCTENGLEIRVTDGPVSKPYIDMTVDIMEEFGINLERKGYTYFKVPGNQLYRPGTYTVEADASAAGYFWAAAALTGKTIKVNGTSRLSRQGDSRLVDLLSEMGCEVIYEKDGLAVSGGQLSGITADMSDMPDMVPTLAVVAAFASGTTIIKNVAHLAVKESDRLTAVVTELTRMGIDAKKTDTGLRITGGKPHGAEIETYDDHRIAMSFALAGLLIPGVEIGNPSCVEKSFPKFWKTLEGIYA
ncbi:MAG: 3-phosphoshikimate 1-carboxyvinyltransferase [Deltaproteobacteria bacterium]|nr:3-phosphoshikimate 1-carboxyvinyltransferase [Deltaproteobacteria bacterium]